MALNSSGPISLAGSTAGQSIALELSQSATGTISLNDTAVRNLAGVPSGAITMPTNFWGKSSLAGYLATYIASANPSPPYPWTGNIDSSGRIIMTWGNGGLRPSLISLSSTFALASTTVPDFNPFIGVLQTVAAPQQGTNSSGRFCVAIGATPYLGDVSNSNKRLGISFLNGFTYGATGSISQRTIAGTHPEPSGLYVTTMMWYQPAYNQGNALNYDATIGLNSACFFGAVLAYDPKGSPYFAASKRRAYVVLYNTSASLTNSVYLVNKDVEEGAGSCGFDSSNNVYTTAHSSYFSGGYTLYTKFNSSLTQQWTYTNNDYGIFCGADSSGNTYWHTYTGGSGLGSVWKVSSGGSVVWGKTYSGPYVDRKQFKIQNDILLGCTRDNTIPYTGYIVRIDISNGNITWQRRIYNNPVGVNWYNERWVYDGVPRFPINDGTNYVYPGSNGATMYLLKMPVSGAVGTGSTALGNYGTTTAFSAVTFTPTWNSESVTWSSLTFTTNDAWSYASASTQSISTGTITTF
jgi:hypothetical protein